jgi:phage gp45-like
MKIRTINYLLAFILILASCQEEEIQDLRKKQEYSFYSEAIDKSNFEASIRWGRNDLEYTEHVNTSGFASSVKLGSADLFVLATTAPGLQVVITNNLTGDMRLYTLDPGQVLTVGP